jgi:hypothetical protein
MSRNWKLDKMPTSDHSQYSMTTFIIQADHYLFVEYRKGLRPNEDFFVQAQRDVCASISTYSI